MHGSLGVLEKFKDKRWRSQDLGIVGHVNDTIRKFKAEGTQRATLRSIYYDLVQQNLIVNEIAMYSKLGDLVTDGRLCGFIPWDFIVDLGRETIMASQWDNVEDLVEGAIAGYRLDRWAGQPNYVEVCVEKEGMTVSLEQVTNEWHVRLTPNKGYASTTALYGLSKRILDAQDKGLEVTILYGGDHDPSGLDMDRDIADRLSLFGVDDVTVDRVALTTAQVRRHNPPPNPAKLSDARAENYIREHGRVSWEVNALSPATVNRLFEAKLKALIDLPKMNAVIAKEKQDTDALREATRQIVENERKRRDRPL